VERRINAIHFIAGNCPIVSESQKEVAQPSKWGLLPSMKNELERTATIITEIALNA
jgi:hypothetical protein